jgi:hypothetical protein
VVPGEAAIGWDRRVGYLVASDTWSTKWGDEVCFGDQAVVRREDENVSSTPCLAQEVMEEFLAAKSWEEEVTEKLSALYFYKGRSRPKYK